MNLFYKLGPIKVSMFGIVDIFHCLKFLKSEHYTFQAFDAETGSLKVGKCDVDDVVMLRTKWRLQFLDVGDVFIHVGDIPIDR